MKVQAFGQQTEDDPRDDSSLQRKLKLTFLIICLLVQLLYAIFEIIEIKMNGLSEYMGEYWNLIELP